jgi:hypothetical protein
VNIMVFVDSAPLRRATLRTLGAGAMLSAALASGSITMSLGPSSLDIEQTFNNNPCRISSTWSSDS